MERRSRRGQVSSAPTGTAVTPAANDSLGIADQAGDVELLEDRTIRMGGGRAARRMGLSLPGAIAGTFLVSALALGAALGPMNLFGGAGHERRDDSAAVDEPKASDELGEFGDGESAKPADDDGGDGDEDGKDDEVGDEPDATDMPVDGPDASDKPDEEVEPTDKPEPTTEPTNEPEPEPTPKPTPKPTEKPVVFGLEVWLAEGKPVGEFGICEGFDVDYYKVVRSADETVTWPTGDDDSLIAAIGPDGKHKFWDGEAPSAAKAYYRVFCVRSGESGYVVLASTNVAKVWVPENEPKPTPEPYAMGFEVDVTGEGVVLHWEACGSDGFTYYKVVRSTTTDNPSYFPWTDGTELIGVIEDGNVTGYTDAAIESGMTITYRIQSIGYWDGQKVLLGQTEAITVTIP